MRVTDDSANLERGRNQVEADKNDRLYKGTLGGRVTQFSVVLYKAKVGKNVIFYTQQDESHTFCRPSDVPGYGLLPNQYGHQLSNSGQGKRDSSSSSVQLQQLLRLREW